MATSLHAEARDNRLSWSRFDEASFDNNFDSFAADKLTQTSLRSLIRPSKRNVLWREIFSTKLLHVNVNVRFPYSEYLKIMLFKTKFARNFCFKLYRFTDVQTFYEHYGYLYQMHEELPLMRLDYPLFELSMHVRVADRSSQAQSIPKALRIKNYTCQTWQNTIVRRSNNLFQTIPFALSVENRDRKKKWRDGNKA